MEYSDLTKWTSCVPCLSLQWKDAKVIFLQQAETGFINSTMVCHNDTSFPLYHSSKKEVIKMSVSKVIPMTSVLKNFCKISITRMIC